jgi:hypothetical protein
MDGGRLDDRLHAGTHAGSQIHCRLRFGGKRQTPVRFEVLPAKQKGMKNRKSSFPNASESKPGGSYSPSRGTALFHLLETNLTEIHSRKLTFQETALYAGQSTSTIFDWLTSSKLRQIEAAIRLLELLPNSKRMEIINKVCRVLPTLNHDRLSWRETQLTCLEQIVLKERGFTVVQGHEDARGFIMTALGHSSWRLALDRHVCGVDIRMPDRFVPVRGVVYLNQPLGTDRIKDLASKALASIRSANNCFVLLNGIWGTIPESHEEILALAGKCHVVVADSFKFAARQFAESAAQPAHLINAKQEPDKRIEIDIQPL